MKQKLSKQDTGFTQVKNSVLNDKNLSLKAKGLFAYIYSKPDNWDFSTDRITEDSLDKVSSVRSAVKELEENEYLTRRRLSTGRVDYFIHFDKKPQCENPTMGKTHNKKIAPISNKDKKVIKNNKEIKNMSAKADGSSKKTLEEFIIWCKKSTQRHIHIIADYADEKKVQFETKEQWEQFMKRNLRPARSLAPYSDEQIGEAMEKLNKARKDYLTDWTLETLNKFLDK